MPRLFRVMEYLHTGKSFIFWPSEELSRTGAVIFILHLRKLNFKEVKRYTCLLAVNKLKKKVKVKGRNIRFALLKMLQWEKFNLNQQQQTLIQHLPHGALLCLSCNGNFTKGASRDHLIAPQMANFWNTPVSKIFTPQTLWNSRMARKIIGN